MTKSSKAFTIIDIYNNYSKENLSNSTGYLDKETFKSILNDFFKLISTEIVDNGYVYKLPHFMGEIYIKRFKPKKDSKRKPVDWKLTNEIYGEHNKNVTNKEDKKYIEHRNNHSYGYSGRWYWKRKDSKMINKSLFSMKAVRANSRKVSHAIKYKNTINKYL